MESEMNNLPTAFDDEDDVGGVEGKQLTSGKVYSDPVADQILGYYKSLNLDDNEILKFGIMVAPLGVLMAFYTLVSSSASCFIAFSAFMTSLVFLGIALNMLCEILKKDIGPRAMQDIAEVIREGSEGFFVTQYSTIFKYAILTSVAIFFMYFMREIPAQSKLGLYFSPLSMGIITSVSFLIGAVCSAIAGYAGIWVSVRANLRVAAASKRCYNDAIQICFRGGAFAAIINVALAIFGISFLYLGFLFYFNSVGAESPPIEEIPVLLVGFSFGASFVAMFAQLGGGIYTKAADVGADLIGKVEAGIPEDDARNPAVVADLVGDNVGDCAGQCADLFESISAEILSAMILGGALGESSGMTYEQKSGFILFPLCVHSLDLVVSTIGIYCVRTKPGLPSLKANYGEFEDPLEILKRGYYVSLGLAIVGLYFICQTYLNIPSAPQAFQCFFACACIGVMVSFMCVMITQYYTDYNYGPVQSIAKSSEMGHATNIITGLSVGMESTGLPVLTISVAIISSYYFGEASGITDDKQKLIGGLYATAVATMGMFASGVYVLSMSGFGPIADNAGGIVEMSG